MDVIFVSALEVQRYYLEHCPLATFQKIREDMKHILHDIKATMERYKKEDPGLRAIWKTHADCKQTMKKSKQNLDRMDCPEGLVPVREKTQKEAEEYFHMVHKLH